MDLYFIFDTILLCLAELINQLKEGWVVDELVLHKSKLHALKVLKEVLEGDILLD